MKRLFMLMMLGLFGLSFTACDNEGPVERQADEIEEYGDELEERVD